jgi:membrane protease YdiL (CAAX protease family)
MKGTIFTFIFHMLVISPLIYIGFRKQADKFIQQIKYIGIFAGFYFLNNLIYLLPHYIRSLRFINGNYTWEAKTLSIFMGIIFLIVFKELSRKECSLTFKQEKNSLKNYFMITLLLCLVIGGALYAFIIRSRELFSWETVIFQISMPGIEEELIFRGILLALLNKVYNKNFTLGGARFGWGLIIVSLSFGLAHGLQVDSTFQIAFNPIDILLTGFMGFWFGWIKERTGSLLLPICMHNLTNTINNLIVMLK